VSFAVTAPRDDAERRAALALRVEVFCDEQGVPRELELDERDQDATHLVAVSDAQEVVGTCRVVFDGPTAKLGRMAVSEPWRRRGIGTALLDHAIVQAREMGSARVTLNAQRDAESLYAARGFTPIGARFEEAGIEHVAMELELA
jgi:predicted GNAT family N-acyltransferase